MAEFRALFSGSSGNSYFLGNAQDGGILVDAGVSCRRIKNALTDMDTDIDKIKGILITHEHSDHIAGLQILLKYHEIPVFSSFETLEYLYKSKIIKNEKLLRPVDPENDVEICEEFSIRSFETSHDAVSSVGFRIEYGDNIYGIATDLGKVTDQVRSGLYGADLVLLESNYDEEMLISGSYPEFLKRRVAGNKGHLSNYEAANLATELISSGTTRIVLGHLSAQNNLPYLAEQTVISSLFAEKMIENRDYILEIAKRDIISSGVYF